MEASELLANAKAVLIDFDGIIIDSEWPIYESWQRAFETEGQTLALETYVQCIGSDFDTWSPEKYLEELTGKEFDWPAINAKRQVELESDLVGVQPLPGARELFEKLTSGNGSNKSLAVVSSSSHRWVDMWLEKLDLVRHTDHVVCRGDAPRIKPAPDLYLEAVKRFSLKPEECLVIEDSLNGVKAGNAAGCRTIAVPSRLTSCLDFSDADAVIDSLTVLL
ncbi:MAG: HAD superfamily hydrolase (TIGR01509 family) [Cryomorphaceae bacterium]|jgi:HAD superfamily hydrolase (TIGR01509 family)